MLLLCVYVDDFKLAGPTKNLSAGWKAIRSCLKTEAPSELHLYLGCIHRPFEATAPVRDGSDDPPQKGECTSPVRGIEYDMDDFLKQCIDRYCELATQSNGKPVVLKHATTPFLGYNEQNSSPQGAPAPGDLANAHTCPYCFNLFEPSADTRGDRAK